MPDRFCHSCTMPLDIPGARGAAKDFCRHCTDEDGTLKSKKDVLAGIAGWFKSWQGKISDEVARKRAAHFMKAMPAWANGNGASTGRKLSAKAGRRTAATTKRPAPRKATKRATKR